MVAKARESLVGLKSGAEGSWRAPLCPQLRSCVELSSVERRGGPGLVWEGGGEEEEVPDPPLSVPSLHSHTRKIRDRWGGTLSLEFGDLLTHA